MVPINYYEQVLLNRHPQFELSMFDLTKLHPGLHAQHKKLRQMGTVLLGLMAVSLIDLMAVVFSSDPTIIQWRPAAEPALIMVLLIGAFLIHSLVWRKLILLRRASDVVQSTVSRPMNLETWKRDLDGSRILYWFELEPEDSFGCVVSSYAVVVTQDSTDALAQYCEQSWKEKSKVNSLVKAFVDDLTGLPVALQTTDALNWVGLNVHPINPDVKDKMLQSADSNYQLSGEAK
jgi:hypothetical protein